MMAVESLFPNQGNRYAGTRAASAMLATLRALEAMAKTNALVCVLSTCAYIHGFGVKDLPDASTLENARSFDVGWRKGGGLRTE